MQTRAALAKFSGYDEDDGPAIRDPHLFARYQAVARAKEAAVAARQVSPAVSEPHARVAARKVKAGLGELDSTLPLVSTFDALRVARATLQRYPDDRGLVVVAQFLTNRHEHDPSSSLSGGQIQRLASVAERAGGRATRAHWLLGEGLSKHVYTQHLPVRRLAALAGQIDTQGDFDRVCREAGLVGPRPDQVLARQFMLGLINRRLAGGGDPMDVSVDEPGAQMGGPKASDGGGALSTDTMGEQLHAKASKIEAALLAGQTVVQNGFSIGIDDSARVFLRTASGAQRLAPLGSMPLVVRDFLHLTAAADPMEPGEINEQQDPWVDLSTTEGGDVLGKDSQTDDAATNAIDPSGTIKQQHPASEQSGTSTSVPPADKVTVRATLVCEKCGNKHVVASVGAPSWVAQPALWARVAERVKVFAAVESAYQAQCKKLGLPALRKTAGDTKCPVCKVGSLRVASGALGPDTSQDEPSWANPAVRPPDNSKPSDQAGTSLADPGAASEPDHQQDPVSWEDPGPIETSRKGPTAAIVDVTATDPRERYRAARAGAPTRAILEGIARPQEWAARRMADQFGLTPAPAFQEAPFDKNASRFRDDLIQVGAGDLCAVPGQYKYRFAFNTQLGRPHDQQVQAYLDKATNAVGAFRPIRIAQVEKNQLEILVADTSHARSAMIVPQADDTYEQKRSAVRAALVGGDDGNQGGAGMASDYAGTVLNRSGSNGMTVKDVPSAAPDEGGGEKNAGSDPDDASCPSCGGHNVEHYGTEGERQCADCSHIFKKSGAIAPACPNCGASCGPVEGGYKCAGCGTMMKSGDVPPEWENTVKDMKDDPGIDNPFALVNWMDNQGYEPGEKDKKEGAKIHEGWGDGGAFERSIEADTPHDLWKLHQGLNGGPTPDWPHMPAKPDGAAQAGAGAPPQAPSAPAEGVSTDHPPQEPEPDSSGKARLPEPEPQPIAGQAQPAPDLPPGQVPEVRSAARRWSASAT